MLVLSATTYTDCARAGRLGNQLFVWASLLSLASLLPGDVRFQGVLMIVPAAIWQRLCPDLNQMQLMTRDTT